MNRGSDEWTKKLIDLCMGRQMNMQMRRGTDRWTSGFTDRWIDRWIDRWVGLQEQLNGWIYIYDGYTQSYYTLIMNQWGRTDRWKRGHWDLQTGRWKWMKMDRLNMFIPNDRQMDGHRMRMNGWTKGQMGRWANRQSFKKSINRRAGLQWDKPKTYFKIICNA